MPDFLFVNPPLSMTERYGDLAIGGSNLPPLGLANLAAAVRAAGFSTAILDAAILKMTPEQTIKKITDLNPRVVGFTAATVAIGNFVEIARGLKKIHPNMPVVVGGAHISAATEATLMRFHDCIDAGVIGEGDATAVELLDTLLNGKPIENIPGLALWHNGKVRFTAPRPLVHDMDSLPPAARDLLPNLPRYYSPASNCYLRSPSTSVITSRGCPGRCTFCDRTVSTNVLRGHSTEYLIEEIEALRRDFVIRDIIFYDDNFVTLRKRLHTLCEAMISRGSPVSWSCTARVDMVSPEGLKLMKKAGCWQIAYGIESGSQEILDSLNKGITLETIRQTLKWTQKAGINNRGYFMIGVPGESVETIKKTIAFMKSLPLDDFHISYFTPWPASQLYHEIKRSGYYKDIDEMWGQMSGWLPVYVPDGMTAVELERWHRRAFVAFYLRPRPILRYLKNSARNPAVFVRMIRGGYGIIKAAIKSLLLKQN
ncbi:MAG: radical SAM protein [bacterium]